MDESPRRGTKGLANIAVFAGLGLSLIIEMMVAIGAGYWLGNQLDLHFHTRPWLMILGVTLFLTLSLVHIIKTLQRVQDRMEAEEKRRLP